MADDVEVLRELWDGRVPVAFSLAADEVFAVDQPDQLFLLLPRQTYLPLVTEKVQRYFVKFIDPDRQTSPVEMWLEDDFGNPVRWHYPIGVLYDLSCGSRHDDRSRPLPWSLTVHFQNFPEQDLLHCAGRDAVESNYMSAVKEADSLKHRGQVVNAMQRKDHKQLWTSLLGDRFDLFWAVNRRLMERCGTLTPAGSPEPVFRHIPFRVHQPDRPYVMTLIRPVDETGRQNTLVDLLKSAVPHILDDADTGAAVSHGTAAELGATSVECGLKRYRVIVQGVQPSLDTPLQWLSEHMSYPDNFLHVCVMPVL